MRAMLGLRRNLSHLARRGCATVPPPAASPAPPASSVVDVAGSSADETPQPPAGGVRCGGFFFALDPNVGLWNDRLNPNWRLTFTDNKSNEKQRIPYAMAIQNRGPHVEFAIRMQYGFVSCDGTFAAVPSGFDVESGWEVTFPLPLSGVRFCKTVIKANDGQGTLATVYCVDCAFGLCAGFQRVVSGVGVKGNPEPHLWRGDVATVVFILAAVWGVYNLLMLPKTWQDLLHEFNNLNLEPDVEEEMFQALDFDGDGYITRDDMHQFARVLKQSDNAGGANFDANAVFDALDVSGSGHVSFDEFKVAFQRLVETMQQIEGMQQNGGMQGVPGMVGMPGMPFGGSPAPMRRDVELQPFGGVFNPGMGMGMPGAGPRFPRQ